MIEIKNRFTIDVGIFDLEAEPADIELFVDDPETVASFNTAEEAKAYISQIKAAGKLLEACEATVKYLGGDRQLSLSVLLSQILEAIAAAKGKP